MWLPASLTMHVIDLLIVNIHIFTINTTNSSQAFGLKDFPMMRPGEFIQMDDGVAAGKEVTFETRIS